MRYTNLRFDLGCVICWWLLCGHAGFLVNTHWAWLTFDFLHVSSLLLLVAVEVVVGVVRVDVVEQRVVEVTVELFLLLLLLG